MTARWLILLLSLLVWAPAQAQVLVYQTVMVGSVFDVYHASDALRSPVSGAVVRRSFLIVDWKLADESNLNQKLAIVDYYTTVEGDGFVERKYQVTQNLRYRSMDAKVNVGVNPLSGLSTANPNSYNSLNSVSYETFLNPAAPALEYCQIQVHPKGFIQMGGDGRITGLSLGKAIPTAVPPPRSAGLGITRQYVAESTTGTTTEHEADVWTFYGVSSVVSKTPLVIAPLKLSGVWQQAYFTKTGTDANAPTTSRHYVAAGTQSAILDRKFTTMTGTTQTVVDAVVLRLRDLGYHQATD
jgi:hypothetical protein